MPLYGVAGSLLMLCPCCRRVHARDPVAGALGRAQFCVWCVDGPIELRELRDSDPEAASVRRLQGEGA